MRPIFITATAAGFVVLLILSGSALAQANRTFVSGHGSDSNPCTLSAPCRSFAQALTQTNAGGEITILDPAGYGSVNITKSVSIVNDGVGEAGVTTASAVDAIDITIGANDVVNLRGLTLVGGGVGNNGIVFNKLGALNVQNCVIRGFVFDGLILEPTGTAAFNVSDAILSDNSGIGIAIEPSGSGTVTGMLNRVQAIGSNIGFDVDGSVATGTVNVTIANSTAVNNGDGILTGSGPGQASTQVMVTNTVASNNGTGIKENGVGATTYLAKNTISGNSLAFAITSGALFSFGDNDIKGNVNDGGAIPLVATK